MTSRRKYAILLFSLLTALIYAEPLIINIDSAVEMALENNLSMETENIDLEKSRRDLDTIWNSFLPTISATAALSRADRMFSTEPEIDPILAAYMPTSEPLTLNIGFTAQLNLNIALFTGIEVTKLNYQAGLLSRKTATKDLERNVRKAFYGLIATRANMELVKKNIETSEKQYLQAEENYKNGLISELDLLSVKVGVENLRPAYNSIATAYENSLMMFKFLLGIDRKQEIKIAGKLDTDTWNFDAEALIERYIDNRLDIRALKQALELQELGLRAAVQQAKTPTLSLSAGWAAPVNDPFTGAAWEEGTWMDQATASISVIMPLDGFIPKSSTWTTLEDTRDSIRKTGISLELARENAGIEITNIVLSLDSGKKALETYGLNVDLAERAYNMTFEAYNLGTREYLEVESAQNEFFKAEQDVLMEKFNYLSGLLDLEYALNTPLSEIIME